MHIHKQNHRIHAGELEVVHGLLYEPHGKVRLRRVDVPLTLVRRVARLDPQPSRTTMKDIGVQRLGQQEESKHCCERGDTGDEPQRCCLGILALSVEVLAGDWRNE